MEQGAESVATKRTAGVTCGMRETVRICSGCPNELGKDNEGDTGAPLHSSLSALSVLTPTLRHPYAGGGWAMSLARFSAAIRLRDPASETAEATPRAVVW